MTPERRRSVRDRVLLDVNALAIYLVEDHPGFPYISVHIEPGFTGERQLLVFDYLPLRAHWVLTSRWGISEEEARRALISFLEQPILLVGATKETVRRAYEIAREKQHDVFDCFYISLARDNNATHLLTTDTDFERLCLGEDFEYLNPVPSSVLSSFGVGRG